MEGEGRVRRHHGYLHRLDNGLLLRVDGDEYENCNLFNEILAYEDIHRVINWPLCSPKCEETKDVSSFCFVTFHLGESIPIVEKFIEVQKSGTIIFGIFDQIVDSSILGINPATNIDEFKENINAFEKIKQEFLTNQTAEGKMCQDPLEKFFGMIRQAAGPNDHPTTPTFLHLYKILSVYSVLKPPKYGNCTINISDTPRITLADLHTIFHDKTTERFEKISKLKTKLDQLICDGLWEPCDWKKCSECITFFKSGDPSHSAAALVALKSKGSLIFPNTHLYNFISAIEHSFSKYCHEFDVFEKVVQDVTGNDFNFKYSCAEHSTEVATEIIVYYIQMRLRQYSYQENMKLKKISSEKKKISKFYNS
ncbi:THAP-type domain-containing protein, partial [Aphis craccivora]